MKKITLITLMMPLLFACKKQTIDVPTENPVKNKSGEAYQALLKMGYDEKNIVERDDYYLVEGDILYAKVIEKREASDENMSTTKSFYKEGDLIHINDQQNLTIKIDNSIPSQTASNWRNAIDQAIANWNNVPNCRLHFTLITSGTPNILIKSDMDRLPQNRLKDGYTMHYEGSNEPVATETYVPWDDRDPSEITVNTEDMMFSTPGSSSPYNPYPLANMVSSITHSIGHCVGLAHHDFNNHYIPGTSSNDPSSVMYDNSLHRNTSFSADDIAGIQYLYGYDSRRIHLITDNGNFVMAVNGGNGNAVASSTTPTTHETFRLMVSPLHGAPYYVLQSSNGRYLQANNGGGGNVTADSYNPWNWETFEIIPSPYYPGKFNLKVYGSNWYLQADQGGGGDLNASSPNNWAWETFTIVDSYH